MIKVIHMSPMTPITHDTYLSTTHVTHDTYQGITGVTHDTLTRFFYIKNKIAKKIMLKKQFTARSYWQSK